MAITPLPEATINLLGSSQTLSTSLSLVKELVDNALDAKATSVDVFISQNTLDEVKVRDNGHGISPDDLKVLGRRGHTSKLRSFDELKSVGGITLGFRGEALASAVQLGEVTVTTKTEGDAVGTCVTLKAPGGILKQTRASHAVGTTVCVKNLFSRIPVRKQTALKMAPRILVKTKELLQNYAMARPTVKLSLKVTKESKGSWSFVPRPSEGIRGAATQVIGRDAAAECVEKSLSFPERKSHSSLLIGSADSIGGETDLGSQTEGNVFVVQMFLPKPGADSTKITHGQYLSVDSRPIANDKGTMKKIVTIFKAYFKGSIIDTADNMKNPFFRMNIICPIASYDPNVEPAKDDILFANEAWVIESIETFFKDFYGEQEIAQVHRSKQSSEREDIGFKLLLAREPLVVAEKTQDEAPIHNKNTSASPSGPSRKTIELTEEDEESDLADDAFSAKTKASRSKWGIDMSNALSQAVEDLQPRRNEQTRSDIRQFDHAELDVNNDKSSNLNPWVIAKLTAPLHPTVDVVTTLLETDNHTQQLATQHLSTPRSSDPPISEARIRPLATGGSRQRKVSNEYRWTPEASGEVSEYQVEPTIHRRRRLEAPAEQGNLQESDLLVGDDATQFARRNDFISARNVTEEYLSHPNIPESVKLPKKVRINPKNLNKPFVSPLVSFQNSSLDNLRQTTLQGARQTSQVEQNDLQEKDPDLEWSMDYENRKEEFTRQQRLKLKAARAKAAAEEVVADADADVDVVRASPHKNRYHAALVTLSQEEPPPQVQDKIINRRPIKINMPEGDPRAYLIRRQRSKSVQPGMPSKSTRVISNRLPLERVPEKDELTSLMLTIPTNADDIRKLASKIGEEDIYIQNGKLGHGLLMTVADTPDIIRRVKEIATRWKEAKTDGDLEFEYSFGNLAQMRIELSR